MYEQLVKRLRAVTDGSHEDKCDGCPYDEDYHCCTDCLDTMLKQAADVVERLRWIPVEERLPKDEKDVLAYYGFRHDGELSSQRFIGTLAYFAFDPNPHWQHEGQGFLQVTHWMPLPEPPEGES